MVPRRVLVEGGHERIRRIERRIAHALEQTRDEGCGQVVPSRRAVRYYLLMRTLALFVSALPLMAQLPAPNSTGIAMGHLHLSTTDAEASKKFWVDYLGGTVAKLGKMDVYTRIC